MESLGSQGEQRDLSIATHLGPTANGLGVPLRSCPQVPSRVPSSLTQGRVYLRNSEDGWRVSSLRDADPRNFMNSYCNINIIYALKPHNLPLWDLMLMGVSSHIDMGRMFWGVKLASTSRASVIGMSLIAWDFLNSAWSKTERTLGLRLEDSPASQDSGELVLLLRNGSNYISKVMLDIVVMKIVQWNVKGVCTSKIETWRLCSGMTRRWFANYGALLLWGRFWGPCEQSGWQYTSRGFLMYGFEDFGQELNGLVFLRFDGRVGGWHKPISDWQILYRWLTRCVEQHDWFLVGTFITCHYLRIGELVERFSAHSITRQPHSRPRYDRESRGDLVRSPMFRWWDGRCCGQGWMSWAVLLEMKLMWGSLGLTRHRAVYAGGEPLYRGSIMLGTIGVEPNREAMVQIHFHR